MLYDPVPESKRGKVPATARDEEDAGAAAVTGLSRRPCLLCGWPGVGAHRWGPPPNYIGPRPAGMGEGGVGFALCELCELLPGADRPRPRRTGTMHRAATPV
jgi:hypothetical protein